jgi:hypothetical protein
MASRPDSRDRVRNRGLLAVAADAFLLIVAGFCAIAMGLGPPFWMLMIGLVAVGGFRVRRDRWWGLAVAAAAGVALLGMLYGIGLMFLAKLSTLTFVIVAIARQVARRRPA